MWFVPLYPDFSGGCLCDPFPEFLMTAILASKVLLEFGDFNFLPPFLLCKKVLLCTPWLPLGNF